MSTRSSEPEQFFARAKRDTIVKEGEVLGETTDYLGRPIGQVKAPLTGLVTFIRGAPSMWQGALSRISRRCDLVTELMVYWSRGYRCNHLQLRDRSG